MTLEQLNKIEKLAEKWQRFGQPEHGAEDLADQTLPLVKALREARERDEGYFNSMEAYRLDVEDCRRRMGDLLDQCAKEQADAHQLTQERDEARAEVERLKAERDEAWDRVDNLEGVIRDNIPYSYDQGEQDEDEANPEECVEYAAKEIADLKKANERLRGIVEVNDRRLAAVWDEARAEVERLRTAIGNALTNGHMNALCWATNDDECVGRCRVLREALKGAEGDERDGCRDS